MDRDILIAAMQARAAQAMCPRRITGELWGQELYARPLLAGEIDLNAVSDKESPDKRALCRNAARLLCDADGNRLIDPSIPEQMDLFASMPWEDVQRILETSQFTPDQAKNS